MFLYPPQTMRTVSFVWKTLVTVVEQFMNKVRKDFRSVVIAKSVDTRMVSLASIMIIPVFWSFLHLHHPLHAKEDDQYIIKEMEMDCRRLMCGEKLRCVYRKNWCRSPPCPSMVFCGDDEEEENPRMPSSCDKVRCSRSYRCSSRYVRDQRTGLYTNTNVQCVVNELKHQAATCAGFKCPDSKLACILREPKCRGFPCRILQACIPEEELKRLEAKCISMNCSSPDHCFLQRPYSCTGVNECNRNVACLHLHGDKPLHDSCRGMMCPDGAKCEPIYQHCDTRAGRELMHRSCKARPGCTAKFGNFNTTGL